MKFATSQEAQRFFAHVFNPAALILANEYSTWRVHPHAKEGEYGYNGYWHKPDVGRLWFRRQYKAHKLHPAIDHVMLTLHYRPIDWQQLLLEWPHRSATDHNRLAYTQNDAKGERDIQTVTTIGKYLQRHFVMPDHQIRDVVALYVDAGQMEIRSNMPDILDAVRNGPRSCMSNDISVRCDDGVYRHPYEVYNPVLGWSMAVRINEGRIDGRALVYKNDVHHYFVRSYKRDAHGGYSYADEMLESWLKAQGIAKLSGWSDARIAKYPVGDGFLAPYLDGSDEYVYPEDGVLIITDDSDCDQAQETNGITAEGGGTTCDDCGSRQHEDDMYWVGRYEDHHVCSSCCDNEYTYVYGRNRNQYYLDNNQVIEANGDYYDEDYYSDYDIVRLHDGEYVHMDNAVYIESQDEYYDCDDSSICYAVDTQRYELEHDCWLCEATCDYYTDDTDYVEVDGLKYHPDHAPEQADETNETN